MRPSTPYKIKMDCVYAAEQGMRYRDIYEKYYKPYVDDPMLLHTFKVTLGNWRKVHNRCPNDTLDAGTYENFTAHGATVQVNSKGDVVQAWIKQTANPIDPKEFIEIVSGTIEPYKGYSTVVTGANRMLEIPLFDMHWGINHMSDYKVVLNEILELIESKHWAKIVIPFGQDFFHNDSIVNGHTTKGTVIDKVDMVKAIREGKTFMCTLIESAIKNSNEVSVVYSCGNHDASISWMFIQVLKERYGDIVDDSFKFRKCVAFGKNAIMFTHGNSKQATAKNLAHIFPIAFPMEFGLAEVREVHAGHLHHEAEADIFGVMVRRLSSGTDTTEWTDKEDYVGAHKRFMLFEYDVNKLRAIHYI